MGVSTFRLRMSFKPQLAGRDGRIDPRLAPPFGFIAMTMDLAVMSPAERHGELVADLAAERPALSKAQVMGVAGFAAADQTSLLRHKAHMVAIADAPRLGMGEDGLIDAVGAKLRFWLRLERSRRASETAPFPFASAEGPSVTVPSAPDFGSGIPSAWWAAKLNSLVRNTASICLASIALSLFLSGIGDAPTWRPRPNCQWR